MVSTSSLQQEQRFFQGAWFLAFRWLPVWQRNFLVWRKLWLPALLGNFGEPLLYLLALGYGLGSFVERIDEMPYIVFLASGTVCSSAMMSASFEGLYSAYTRMEIQKTWEAMLATPLSVPDIVIGEIVWAATKSLLSSGAILVTAAFLGAVPSGWAVATVPVVFLTGLCFAAMALVVTAFAHSYDFFLYYHTLFITPLLLVGGVFFPMTQMPLLIQQFAYWTPLTHAVDLVRPLMIGQMPTQPLVNVLVLSGYTLVALILAIHLIQRRLTR